jgi:hypothetical protein
MVPKAVIAKTAIAKSVSIKSSAPKKSAKTVQSIAEAMRAMRLAHAIPAQQRIIVSPTMQPEQIESDAQTHKFQVGQTVYYNAPTFGRAPAPGNFTVVKILPSEGDEHQYRIKSNGEAFERVAKESQLDIL